MMRHVARMGGLRRMSTAGGKVFASAEEAVADITAGSTLLVGGFGLSGVPENLLRGIQKLGVGDLKVVSSNVGTAERGLGLLFQTKQISRVTGSYVGENDLFESQFLNGEIEVELVPMGTLAEKMRAAGAGIPAFFTKTGAGTLVQHGGMPMLYASDGSRNVLKTSAPRMAGLFRQPLSPKGTNAATLHS
jgi:3-oxoacid CoA-transferase A subunit